MKSSIKRRFKSGILIKGRTTVTVRVKNPQGSSWFALRESAEEYAREALEEILGCWVCNAYTDILDEGAEVVVTFTRA